MKTILLTALGLAMTLVGFSQFNVTFRVDMSQSGLTFTEANVTGTFTSWCNGCIAMTDSDMDGIWEVTVPLDAGTYEYKFTADGATAAEQLAEGSSCTITSFGFTNRLVTIDADVVLPVVCYGLFTTCPEVVLQQMDLPVTFEDAAVDYGLIGFGGAEASTIEVDPEDPTNMVAKVVKSASAQLWAGTTITAPAALGLVNPVPFTTAQTRMTLRVWSPDAGIPVRLKVEDHTDQTRSVETEATTTVGGAWEVLVFDFANQVMNTAAINYGFTYDKPSVFFNFGTDGATAGEKTYYFDELAFDEAVVEPQTYQVTFSVDMNSFPGNFSYVNVSASFNDFCGNCNPMSDDDMDGIWTVVLPLAAGTYEYKYSYDNGAGSEQLVNAACTVVNGEFVNRALQVTTDAVLPLVCYERCVTCDFIQLAQMDLPVTFDLLGTEYGLIGFGGAENSTIVEDPTMMGNMVAQVVKSASAQLWAGTTITAPSELGLLNPVPFTATQTRMTLRVWSPDAGIPVRLKVEEHADNTHTVETEAMTTVAGQWETLTFDFANQAAGTAALNLAYNFDKASVFFNFGTDGVTAGEKTYFFDDLEFDDAVVEPVSRTVTFQVDMNNAGISFTTMNVSGTFNNWCGNCASMTDANADGIWEYTTTLLEGSYEYKFSYDNGAGSEQLTAGFDCTVINGDFVNRSLVVSADVTLPVVCYASCLACNAANTYNVLFRVDMNNVTSAFTTPEVNGIFNGWCGGCAPMSDTDGDGIWELNIALAAGSYEYKFAYDNWAGEENLTSGSACTITTGEFTNRLVVVSGDTALDVVCWESCSACDNPSGPFNITFQVDMGDVSANFITPEVNGTFNGWCGNCAAMTDANSDDIWEITIPLQAGSYDYKFSYDTWTGQESLTPGSSCTTTSIDGFTNRLLVVTENTTLPVVCWESCEACVTSVSENELDAVQVYPNPVSDELQINLSLNASNAAVLNVLDASGRIVMQKQLNNMSRLVVDTKSLNDGFYFIQVVNEGTVMTKSFVVQH
jgi:1,4-alpha-glucan branching enzyme